MKRKRTPGDLHALAESYLTRIDPEGRRFTGATASAWKRVAGPDVERHTMGVSLKDGSLLVYVDQSAWAQNLSLMAEQYRERLNEEIGEELVRAVRFTVSRKVAEERRREQQESADEAYYEPDDTESVPLTEQERQQIEHIAGSIHDERVRDAAVRAVTRHLEWKKGIKRRNGPQAGSE
jgi:hypothetical protein